MTGGRFDRNTAAPLVRERAVEHAAVGSRGWPSTTTVTQAEFLCGVAILPDGKRRAALEEAVQGMFEEDFARRVLPFDGAAAHAYATIAAGLRRNGRPTSQLDAQIAAIALSRGAALAARNVGDFEASVGGILVPRSRGVPPTGRLTVTTAGNRV